MAKIKLKIGIVMDPLNSITPEKDSSLAMLLEAQFRGHEIYYMEQKDLSISNGEARADVSNIQVYDDNESWFKVTKEMTIDLKDLDVILMRKDPPFDME